MASGIRVLEAGSSARDFTISAWTSAVAGSRLDAIPEEISVPESISASAEISVSERPSSGISETEI